MIIPLKGNVKFPITLDPTVWIFDDRRIKFAEAFSGEHHAREEQEHPFSSEERFNREVVQATNDNKPISRKDADEILKSTYVIPFKPFYQNAEVNDGATNATIVQADGNEVSLGLEELANSYLLFSFEGKPLKDDGPVHIYFNDGTNKDDPIKGVNEIIIN
ncbi:hypothetical protein [Oceanobacillus alkalisoli]|uniref:hypothetical protein n=1 Tax=Oceanobacillus alkalisoli TaxID=2925113 RepID=UPI001EE45C5B|nr:hypothetical protein [Oceanobacillus alkalisoli]MCG5103612.1 hypothetical protein [Oceanobacillus alkalisoli]